MVTQTLDIVLRFLRYPLQESRVVRIGSTGKQEVLPDENSPFVSFLIKLIVFVDTASPHTDHVHVRPLHVFHQADIAFRRHVRQQGVVRNHVRPLSEQRLSVHLEIEGFSVLVLFLHDTDAAQPDLFLLRGHFTAVHRYGSRKVIQGRFSPAVRHPQMRLVDDQRQADAVLSGSQTDRLFQSLFHPLAGIVNTDYRLLFLIGDIGHFQLVLQPCLLLADSLLTHVIVIDAGIVVEDQLHRPPDAGSHQPDSPVPTVGIRSLAAVHTDPLFRMVVIGRIVEPVAFPLGQRLVHGRAEPDHQPVLSFPQHRLHRQRISYKHVVRFQ